MPAALRASCSQVAELHAAPAPLMVSQAAGGHTEWFRGAYALLCEAATSKATAGGYALYAPAGPWLRARVAGQAEALYEASTHLLRAIEAAQAYGRRATTLEVQLRNLLDACGALGLEVAHRVPQPVLSWYRPGAPAAA